MNQKLLFPYAPSKESFLPVLGAGVDLVNAFVQGYAQSLGKANRVVGVAPQGYFTFHQIGNAAGFTIDSIPAAIVREGFFTSTAHEIGHTFGLRLLPIFGGPGEEYTIVNGVVTFPGNLAEVAFSVRENRPIEFALCFMGTTTQEDSFLDSVGLERWVEKADYEFLFSKQLKNVVDPDILLVSGIVLKNGTVLLNPWFVFENATEVRIPEGNFSLLLSDNKNGIVENASFGVGFVIQPNPHEEVETNVSGFAFAIPYPENTSTATLVFQNQTLFKFDPREKVLSDAINSIPDRGFINNPSQRRNALLNKANAIMMILQHNNIKGAIQKLESDMKDKADKWLVDFQKESSLEVSKEDFIRVINNTIERIEST